MITIDVRADIRQAQRFLTNLRKNAVPMAAARAINDTLITVRAEGARMIKAEHPALKIGDIKERMTMKRAFKFNLRGMVATQGYPLSALLFRPTGGGRAFTFRRTGTAGIYNAQAARSRPVSIMFGKKRGVVSVDGRKGFRIGKFGNEVFVRKLGKGRQVRRFRGPSMPGVFRAQGLSMQRLAQQKWSRAFASRLQYEIQLAKR